MLSYDVRRFDNETREKLAWKAHEYKDFQLPELRAWNYDLCRVHRRGWVENYFDHDTQQDSQRTVTDKPKPGCRKCCILFRQHQLVGIMWLYLKKNALLADTMGSGKTATAGGLIAMLIETGELGPPPMGKGRAIITPRAAALTQWQDEFHRMMPGLNVIVAEGNLTDHDLSVLPHHQIHGADLTYGMEPDIGRGTNFPCGGSSPGSWITNWGP